ncbi:hypothetical protein [Polyangium aurulentum]|uniref:hypothetical protein n=1 Tax=Polyangium aurulentum TaxID=2567896 RepID=UPI0010AEA006|nr:hypothetical protein [Polyangium aurulentum]UQA55958.1 hypothetical protein E8A73_032155 [Polyangium aurulentum]
MTPGRRLAPRISAALLALAAPALALTGACADENNYLLVELAPHAPATAAHVRILKGTTLVNAFCVSLSGNTTASFVLERDTDEPADAPVTIEVRDYSMILGQDGAAPGKTFSCPSSVPGDFTGVEQVIETGFCDGASRALRFVVGASCATSCDAGETCGAGISTGGTACSAGSCCRRSIEDACTLENAP